LTLNTSSPVAPGGICAIASGGNASPSSAELRVRPRAPVSIPVMPYWGLALLAGLLLLIAWSQLERRNR
jgi:hypothetical protein